MCTTRSGNVWSDLTEQVTAKYYRHVNCYFAYHWTKLWNVVNESCTITDLNYWIKHPFEFSDPILKPEYL